MDNRTNAEAALRESERMLGQEIVDTPLAQVVTLQAITWALLALHDQHA